MRKNIFAFLAVLCAAAATAAPKPKLVVAIAVDQFRYDYLTRFRSEYMGGLNQLLTKGAVFTNALYPLSPSAKASLKGPCLREGAKVGAGATLLPGVTVGRNALVGAGAVVVRDVPDHKVAAGNPARVINDVRELAAYDARALVGGQE